MARECRSEASRWLLEGDGGCASVRLVECQPLPVPSASGRLQSHLPERLTLDNVLAREMSQAAA
jgi:hypothetical protein